MLFLSQIFVFIFVFFIILLNIRSLANEGDFITDVSSFSDEDPTHDLSFLYRSSKITIKQQLKSRLPNINEPLRDLKLGKLNFLHTTDTHGWYLGHLNQKQYSSDWGDFISLHANLLSDLNNQGSDLLLVDTGDRHDGNGLSDLTYPNGELSSKIFMMMDYDLITVGNHELYREEISQYEYENLVPRYGESFISTNVQYLNDNDEWVVFGNNTHRYFETKVNKYKILSFSFMFDFKMGNRRVNVVPIAEILEQSWFLELVDDYASNYEVDALVIFGHIPVAHDWIELSQLHNFFRSRFPSTYIQYFGGHSHIRDFSVLDDLSTALQSGRYCETVGFLSIDDFPKEGKNESYAKIIFIGNISTSTCIPLCIIQTVPFWINLTLKRACLYQMNWPGTARPYCWMKYMEMFLIVIISQQQTILTGTKNLYSDFWKMKFWFNWNQNLVTTRSINYQRYRNLTIESY